MSSYKIKLAQAKKQAKNFRYKLTQQFYGHIKSYDNAHPCGLSDQQMSNIAKRVACGFTEEFARLLTDRIMIDYLCVNRLSLADITGDLRNTLFDIITEEKEKPNDTQRKAKNQGTEKKPVVRPETEKMENVETISAV